MKILEELQESMKEVERNSVHNGYWYRVSDVLIVLVCGILCNQQTIGDIYEWSQSEPTRRFLRKMFKMEAIPCRAQFYNIIACVNSEKFNLCFISWMQTFLVGGTSGKTVAIDGKTICSTDKLNRRR